MKIKFVKKNQVVLYREVVDGLYRNLANKEAENDRLRDIITINSEREKEHKKKIDEISKEVFELSEKAKETSNENLDLTQIVIELKKENAALKKSVSYTKGYATRYKNKLTLLEGRKR